MTLRDAKFSLNVNQPVVLRALTARATACRFEGCWCGRFKLVKQYVVFQVNVIDQVVVELGNPGIERTPGIAGTVRWVGVIAKSHQLFKHGAMLCVLGTQHAHGFHHQWASTGFEHGKQNVLFLHHVGKQVLLSILQYSGQTVWDLRVVAMHHSSTPAPVVHRCAEWPPVHP